MKYVYKKEVVETALSVSDLNEYGKDGWLLCYINQANRYLCYYFAKLVDN